MSDIYILGTGTAVPDNPLDQTAIRNVVEALFSESVQDLSRLLGVFQHSHIQQRHLIKEPDWYAQDRGFEESNAEFVKAAIELSRVSAHLALQKANTSAADCAGIVVASTTGLMTPTLDAVLSQELGMKPSTTRLPIFGLGCAGGVSGLARAAELSAVRGGAPILFIAVEICSATFQKNDTSKSNLIGSSIFADGAAAVVVGGSDTAAPSARIVAPYSHLFADTYDIMGWDFLNEGFKVRFSRDIPSFVREHVPKVMQGACQEWGIKHEELTSFITHPGGAKVLEAYADATQQKAEAFQWAYHTLENYGNMSSASVLFVLDAMLNNNALEPGYALMSALGPGFSAEQLLLEVRS